jgi:hypothetical protein
MMTDKHMADIYFLMLLKESVVLTALSYMAIGVLPTQGMGCLIHSQSSYYHQSVRNFWFFMDYIPMGIKTFQ